MAGHRRVPGHKEEQLPCDNQDAGAPFEKKDVERSRVGPVERLMRQGADQLACDGVEARITPEQVTRQTLKRRGAAARTFQARSAEILMERASAATLPGRQPGFSRGEEARWTGLGGDENLDEGL